MRRAAIPSLFALMSCDSYLGAGHHLPAAEDISPSEARAVLNLPPNVEQRQGVAFSFQKIDLDAPIIGRLKVTNIKEAQTMQDRMMIVLAKACVSASEPLTYPKVLASWMLFSKHNRQCLRGLRMASIGLGGEVRFFPNLTKPHFYPPNPHFPDFDR